MFYKLVDKKPVEISEDEWFESRLILYNKKHVDFTTVGFLEVSTVFLGFDHSFYSNNSRPILFETMIFNHEIDDMDYQTRCYTWEEAEIMHQEGIKFARKLITKENLAHQNFF